MKIVHKDLKHGQLKVKIDANEDGWYLSSIIGPDDVVGGMTERKLKIGGSEDKTKILKKIVFIKIKVEKVSDENGVLRVSGTIIEAPDDIPRGDYHTFSMEEGTVVSIEKEQWSNYALKKIDEAVKGDKVNILLVAFDREEALFALLKNNGYELLLDLKGDVSKKDAEERKTNFYKEIYSQMIGYDGKYGFSNIIVASPAFWKEYLMKEIDNDSIKKKITLASCSSVDGSTITEILKRPELKTVLEKDKSSRESKIVEQLLDDIRKENAAYGYDHVREKIVGGNVSVLIISENLIKKLREKKDFGKLDRLMNDAEALNADVKIISSEDACKKLDGLSGIAALFRWKENYGN